jgi:hypothetical protein
MKVMSNKLKAQVAFAKSQQNVNKTAMDNWMSKTGQGRTWAAWVESKTGIDPHKDYESFLKANKEYPASKWIDEHTKKQETSGGDKEQEEQKPNGSPSNPYRPQSKEERDQIPKGSYYVAPDGQTYIAQ